MIFNNILDNTLYKRPLIAYCSSYVFVENVCNAILAIGGAPLVSYNPNEIEDIVDISDSLVLNIGGLRKEYLETVVLAGKRAEVLDIPIILYPIGVWVSRFRRNIVKQILDNLDIDVIIASGVEIKALSNINNISKDFDYINEIINHDNINHYIELSKKISQRYDSMVIFTGQISGVVKGEEVYIIKDSIIITNNLIGVNSGISGVLATFIASNRDDMIESALLSCIMLNIISEKVKELIVKENLGLGSANIVIMDLINNMDRDLLNDKAKTMIVKQDKNSMDMEKALKNL